MNMLRTWFDGEVYNKEIELNFKDCDVNKNMKLSSVLAYTSDIAGKDYTARGVSHDRMIEAKQVLLLARYHFHFYRMPRIDEVITISTWEKGIKDGFVIRDYDVKDSDGKSCILASSTWFVANPETRKIIRPSKFTLKEIGVSEREIDCEPCGKIHIEMDKLIFIGKRVIYYSDLDGNGHLNNSNYANIIIDFLSDNYRKKQITDFYINYIKEAKHNETIEVFGYNEGNEYYIVGKIEDNLCFDCRIIFK